jgi:predicted small lipoprotein YifL
MISSMACHSGPPQRGEPGTHIPDAGVPGSRARGRWPRPGMTERLTAIVLLLAVTLALAGCGKKGLPQPPPDEPNTYPRVYPSG